MDLLVFLAEHAGEVMSRQDIIDAVWQQDFVGDTTLSFAGLAFDASGVLWGVTGNDTNFPEALFTISTVDGSATYVMDLGNGSDGESLGYNPLNGLLYHASGHSGSEVIFETVDGMSMMITNIDITGSMLEDEETQALTWWPRHGAFLWKQDHGTGPLFRVTPTGAATYLGDTDHPA